VDSVERLGAGPHAARRPRSRGARGVDRPAPQPGHQRLAKPGGTSSLNVGDHQGAARLRLERRGEEIRRFFSLGGGTTWTAVDPLTPDPAFPAEAYVGIAAAGNGVFILHYLFQGGEAPACLKAADSNDDGGVDLSDAVHLLAYLFTGGSAPAAPSEACGDDLTADALSCQAFAACP